jgi:MoaA/NifB/PqqE/SkfB family radical SAM enzyme
MPTGYSGIKAVKVASKGRLRTRIVTNGSLLSQEKINSLIDAGLDAIAISLNAKTARTYHKVMGGLEFERTVKNIESLLKVAPPTMLVTLTFMVTQDNEHEVADAVEYWARRGVFCAAYGINTMGGMVSSFEDLRPKSAALYDPQRPKECYLPIENAAILVSGDVLLCCTDWSRSTSFGNLTVSRLSEVWHSQLLSNVRLAALTGRFPCKPCQSCPGQTRTMDNLVFYGGPGGSNANI